MQSMDLKTFMNDYKEVSAAEQPSDHSRWILECPQGKIGDKLTRNTIFVLRNSLNKLPLSVRRQYVFDTQSCGQICPIMGHL